MDNKNCVKLVLYVVALCVLGTNVSVFSKSLEKEIIMTIGKENISFGEAKRVYDKSHSRGGVLFEQLTRDSVISFLDTYSKYKLKVIHGINEGYDKDSVIVDEINRNKRVLAETYLIETAIVEPAMKRYTEMRKSQRQIAIIMANFSPLGDTTEAYKKIMAAVEDIKNGETFENAARKYSDDEATASEGGVVPAWVTGLRLQRNLESAIYGLNVGEASKTPLKTDYGYFLIKVLKEEPRIFIGISHILIPYANENTDLGPIVKDSADAKRLADSIVREISRGGNFNSFAEKFSANKTSSVNGGNLGIYARSTGIVGSGIYLSPEMENAAFALKDRQVSDPVDTDFGIQIVRRDSTVVFPQHFEYDEMKANYNRIFLQEDKEKFYDSLAIAYGFELNNSAFERLLQLVDTTKIIDANFREKSITFLPEEPLFSILEKSYSTKDFIDDILLISTTNRFIFANRADLTEAIKMIIQPIIIDNATKNLHQINPMFNILAEEFAAGLILFKGEQIHIYDKVRFDSVRAMQFYDTTKMELRIPLQYDLSEIYIMSKKKADEVFEDIKSGKISFDSAVSLHSQRQGAREKKGKYGVVNTSNYLAYQAQKYEYKVGDISEPLSFEQGFSIIRINDILHERRMTFEEALPHIAANVQWEYQEYLKENWIKELTKKYPVKYNDKLINKVFKKK